MLDPPNEKKIISLSGGGIMIVVCSCGATGTPDKGGRRIVVVS